MLFFSTFASGLEPVVGDMLRRALDDVEVVLVLDGVAVYSSKSPIDIIKRIRFFNNSFLLLRLFPVKLHVSVEKMMGAIARDGINTGINIPSNIRTFRVVTSCENKSVPVNPRLMADVEKVTSRQFRLRVDRSKPDVQFWFLTRSEGYGFFGMRLTQHPDFGKVLARGELRPEMADVMCLLSEPNKDDVFLDPFAGSGATTKARMNYPHKKIIAGDINPKRHFIEKLDATKLERFENGSVDKIVTDPPWGLFDKNVDIDSLYTKTLESFYRVLREGGILVMMVGDRRLFEKLLEKFKNKFVLRQKLHVLVSGKKAGVYKLVRN